MGQLSTTSMKRSYAAIAIAAAILLTAILVAVLLPQRICTYNSCINLIPSCLKATCSGVAELPRVGIALGGFVVAAAVLVILRRKPN